MQVNLFVIQNNPAARLNPAQDDRDEGRTPTPFDRAPERCPSPQPS
jgi:hypothetical protein